MFYGGSYDKTLTRPEGTRKLYGQLDPYSPINQRSDLHDKMYKQRFRGTKLHQVDAPFISKRKFYRI